MKSYFIKYGISLCKYLLVIFTPIIPTILWLGVFVVVDLITGIIKSKRKGEAIQSKRMSETVTKLMLYCTAILSCHVLDTVFLNVDFLPIKTAQLVSGYIAVVEFKSILENISELLGVPIWVYLKDKLYREDKNK